MNNVEIVVSPFRSIPFAYLTNEGSMWLHMGIVERGPYGVPNDSKDESADTYSSARPSE